MGQKPASAQCANSDGQDRVQLHLAEPLIARKPRGNIQVRLGLYWNNGK